VRVALLALTALVACVPAEGPAMQPGQDCLSCHTANAEFAWTAAGTVFTSTVAPLDQGVAGAVVEIVDSAGKKVSLQTTSSGNFYTAEALSFPLHPTVRFGGKSASMPLDATQGSCNGCHVYRPPDLVYPAQIHVP
jgi:hypothetical protein